MASSLGRGELASAVRAIQRRIDELKTFDTSSQYMTTSDPGVAALQDKIQTMLADIFGENTVEYGKYSINLEP